MLLESRFLLRHKHHIKQTEANLTQKRVTLWKTSYLKGSFANLGLHPALLLFCHFNLFSTGLKSLKYDFASLQCPKMKHHCYSFLFWSFKSGHGIPYLEYSMKSPSWPTLMTTSEQLFVLFMAVGGVVRAGKKGWKESLRRCSLMILLLEILWERPSSKILEGQQQNILFKCI